MSRTIVLEEKEVDYVMACLSARPWGEVNTLITKLIGQLSVPPLEAIKEEVKDE